MCKVVMRDCQTNEPIALRFNIERNARMLRIVRDVFRPGPGEHQAARRGVFDGLAHDVDDA